MKKIALWMISILIVACPLPLLADDTAAVVKLTRGKVDEAIGYLKQKELPKEERNKKIIEVVNSIFDFEFMAKLSLGKKSYKKLNKAQRTEFLDLFVEQLKLSYLSKLDLYTDEKVVIEDGKQTKKNRIVVTTYLVSNDDRMEMIYKFYKSKKKGWMVYDVDILGVSLVNTYRNQFAAEVKNGGVDGLMTKLRSKATL